MIFGYLTCAKFQERIEAQERKITTLELSRKLAGGGTGSKKTEAETIIKKLTDAQEKEKECQKVIWYKCLIDIWVVILYKHQNRNVIASMNKSLISECWCLRRNTR